MSALRFPHLPQEAWALYLRDELDDAAADRIDRHLADCAGCSDVLEAEDPVFLFRRLRDRPAPAGTWDGFWETLEPQLAPEPRRRFLPHVLGLAGVAAVVAAGLLVAFMGGPRGGDDMAATLEPPDAAGATTAHVAVDPCPASVASLRLTRDECLALFGAPIDGAGAPQVILSESVDLRGL